MSCEAVWCLFFPKSNRCPKSCHYNQPAVCKDKSCRHLLKLDGLCPNPDCWHHTRPQSEVNENAYKDWRL